jgi:hypothetical protein
MANLSDLFPPRIIIKPVHVYIRSQQYHPSTSINPCFPSNNTKPGLNLARTYLKQKGSRLLTAKTLDNVAFWLWGHLYLGETS